MIPKNRRKMMVGILISFFIVSIISIWFTKLYHPTAEELLIVVGAGMLLGWFVGRYDERRLKEGKWI